jgi:hypothetical protein
MSTNIDPSDDPLHPVATEFVTESFETEATPEDVFALGETIADVVTDLYGDVDSDSRLEALLRSGPGDVLESKETREHEDPEPFTRRKVIEPLLDALGYEEYAVEAGDLSDEYGRQADYSVSLRDVDGVDSERLLFEAEPMNKVLDQERHGVGQVADWLSDRRFGADFGVATDGLRWVLVKYDRDTYGLDVLAEMTLRPVFVAAFENETGRNAPVSEWLSDYHEDVLADFVRTFGYGNFRSIAGDARAVIKRKKQEITDEFYDDYVRLVFGITGDEEERRKRSLVGEGIVAPDSATGDDVRLFAVELMNRLVFVKFLEDKCIVSESLLADLREEYEDSKVPQRFYKAYLEPLFFGVLDERPHERPGHVRDRPIFEDVPYLNGGLFRPSVENGGAFDEADFDVRDSVLGDIINLLEKYDFSADGGPANSDTARDWNLDPSILGNVFEKTINHITGDPGDQKKELGAYYTPDEITRFCAEETVQPALLERFKEELVEDRGWPEAEVEGYDDVYDLVGTLPESTDLVDALLGVVDEFRVLDPACGSGHFLTSVESEIVNVRKALYDKHDDDPDAWELRKRTVVQNIYGVDIVSPAVEIAKLRLWLSIISEVAPAKVPEYDDEELALPNVVFNIRQGNSLIGYTDLIETSSDEDQARLDAWGADTVRDKYGEIIEVVRKHKQTTDTKEAQRYLVEAESLLDEYRNDLDEKVVREFHDAGMENTTLEQVRSYDPFHWVLEFAQVYADGGFDVIVGNPPWEVLTVNRDDFFSRYELTFRTYHSEEKDEIAEDLLEKTDDGVPIREKWEKYIENMETRADYFNNSAAYELQSPEIDGRKVASENDLSALFLERVFDLSRAFGHVSLVLPGNIFNGAASKDLRMEMLDESRIDALIQFENHGIFKDIHNQYQFGVVVFEPAGRTERLHGIFQQRDLEIIEEFEERAIEIPRRVLADYSPKARIFPYVTSQLQVDVLNKILANTPLEEPENWWANILTKELHEPSDKHLFETSEDEGDYPVYGGGNIHQYHHDNLIDRGIEAVEYWSLDEDSPDKSAKHRVREKKFNSGDLKKAIYEEFKDKETGIRVSSQITFVNRLLDQHRDRELDETDILLDCTEYRIAYRDVARVTDERTMIAAVLPPDVLCLHTLQTFKPYEINPDWDDLEEHPIHSAYDQIFSDEELFVAVGLLNSLPFDFLMRTKIGSHMVKYKIDESQVPKLTDGDDWFHYISERAARLNCYGEEFAEMRERLGGIDPATDKSERKRLQAEIDAAAFHAYGLDREETAFVLDDFHRVRDPRMMTEDYFDLVLETYDELADEGPMP